MSKMKTLLVVMCALVLLMAGAAIKAQTAEPLVWLAAETEQVTAGQEFSVVIHVNDAVAIYGGSFKVAYDPQALEVVMDDGRAIIPGAFFDGQPGFTLRNSANAQDGIAEYALTLTQPAEPVSGSGAVGTIRFRALSATTVTVEPVEARLLSPQFSEVNGRRIARQIDELDTRLQGVTITAATAVEAPQMPAQPPASAPVMSQPASASSQNQVALMIGGLLFLVGLATFAASINTYVNLRRQYSQYRRQARQS